MSAYGTIRRVAAPQQYSGNPRISGLAERFPFPPESSNLMYGM